ncbi:hypothetical protein LBMAG42_17650 [Deltaproteobacteria bacterium]|nr:hypothetical protein LBMAG42_17650 [Deltaproteobacteria bacterium]
MIVFVLGLLAGVAGAAEPPPVRGIVSAVPFTLSVPYRSDWSAEHPEVRSGTLLVLDVESSWLVLRNGPQPVLYVGAAPAEVLRRDVEAGRVVVVVPGAIGPEVAVFFGGEALPETVTVEAGKLELAGALAGGAVPLRVPQSATVERVLDHAGLWRLAGG